MGERQVGGEKSERGEGLARTPSVIALARFQESFGEFRKKLLDGIQGKLHESTVVLSRPPTPFAKAPARFQPAAAPRLKAGMFRVSGPANHGQGCNPPLPSGPRSKECPTICECTPELRNGEGVGGWVPL